VLILVLGLGALVAAGLILGEQRAARRIDIKLAPVSLRGDAAAVERGRYLFGSRGCVDCHGSNGGGATLADDGKGLKLAGPNLTAGNPRIAGYQPVDWVRSIRHGVGADGRALRLRRGMQRRNAVQLGAGQQAGAGHREGAQRHRRARPARAAGRLR